jgi:hypothetical protein
MLSGDNISSFAANAERTERNARRGEGRAEAETEKKHLGAPQRARGV